MEARGLGFILAASMMFGFVGTSGAATCAVGDVTINSVSADSCGTADGNTMTPDFNDPSGWSVNLDNAGNINYWSYFEKEEEDNLGSLTDPDNIHDGNTGAISLTVDQDIFNSGSGITTGTFSLNAFDPILITLKGGTNYNWYLFTGQTGPSTGAFDTANLGADLSSLSAYTTVVPVPAAVWLFGSGLLGLVGVARRKRA